MKLFSVRNTISGKFLSKYLPHTSKYIQNIIEKHYYINFSM